MNAFLFSCIALLMVFAALSAIPAATAEGEDSGTLTVNPGEDKTVDIVVPGTYDDTYKIIYSWTITDFSDDVVIAWIEDTNVGGSFANYYKVSSGSGAPQQPGGATYRMHWRNDNSAKSFTVEYSSSYEYVDFSSSDDDDVSTDDDTPPDNSCCCSSIIVAFVPLTVIAFIGYTKFKKRVN